MGSIFFQHHPYDFLEHLKGEEIELLDFHINENKSGLKFRIYFFETVEIEIITSVTLILLFADVS